MESVKVSDTFYADLFLDLIKLFCSHLMHYFMYTPQETVTQTLIVKMVMYVINVMSGKKYTAALDGENTA